MDFTVKRYRELLIALQEKGYRFQTFGGYVSLPGSGVVILRHDVDSLPENAVRLATIEKEMGIRGSYHFRVVYGAYDEEALNIISSMGHEIAYHYEDLSSCARVAGKSSSVQGEDNISLFEAAYGSFCKNILFLRERCSIEVISMHGRPLSVYDNRDMWKYYDYRDLGIVCEPYFDIDLSGTLYLTDTGRRWNGEKTNLRDRASSVGAGNVMKGHYKVNPVRGSAMNMTEESAAFQSAYRYRNTKEIINAVNEGTFPSRAVISTHPQRWSQNYLPWLKELIWQNTKNSAKYILSVIRKT